MEELKLKNKFGGDVVPVESSKSHKTIKTRTKYVLVGSDFSQQE